MTKSSSSQDWTWIACASLTTLTFIMCQVFSILATVGDGVIFQGPTWNISNQTSSEINPAGWTFSIWGVIYIFQALWIIHVLVSIFRTSSNGGRLYKNPEIVSRLFLSVYALNMCLNVTWLILWDRVLFEAALVVLVLITLMLYVILVDYYRRITQNVKVLAREHKMIFEAALVVLGVLVFRLLTTMKNYCQSSRITRNVKVIADEHTIDLILFRLFLQNGISIYATWVSIAILLNLTLVLVNRTDLTQQVACLIALSVLTFEVVVFVVMDWFILERYMRYTFTTYLTIIWALFGVISANWDPTKPHSILSVVLLAITGVLFIGKIVLTIVNSKRKPLYAKDATLTKELEMGP